MNQKLKSDQQRSIRFSKVKDSFFLVRWLQLHSFINIFLSIMRRIKESDLFNLDKQYWPETNIDKFSNIRNQNKNKGLLSLIFKYFILWEYIFAGVLIILATLVQLAGPMTTKQIMTFLSQQQYNPSSKSKAQMFAWILFVSYFVRISITQYSNRVFFLLSVKVTQVLHYQILSKISRMSFDKKFKTQKIYIANNMIINCDKLTNAISSSGVLFSLPTRIISVQILLIIQYQYYGLSFIMSILIGVIIQFFINKKINENKSTLSSIQYQKYGINCQFTKSFKQIRLLGWEDLIILKNQKFRHQQNKVNSLIYKYKGFFDLTGDFVPILAIFISLALYLTIHDNQSIDPIVVFTIINYCGMMSNLNGVYSFISGIKAATRIQELLKAEQLKISPTFNQKMQKGKLVFTDIVAKWRLEGVTLQNIQDMMLLQKKQILFNNDDQNEQVQEQQINQFQRNQNRQLVNNYTNDTQQNIVTFPQQQIASEQFLIQQIKRKKISKFKSIIKNQFKQIQIIDNFQFEKNRLILIGDTESGKSTFLHLIMGNLSIEKGIAQYGGKIGYMPQDIWFQRTSVRNNILFGSILDIQWLKKVYEWIDLKSDLKLLQHGDSTIINQNLFMTQKQKKKIALARSIYCRPDILILDEPFLFLDLQQSKLLYKRLCDQFKDKIIIISTTSIQFVNDSDHILVLQSGKIVEYGCYTQIKQNPNSFVHKISSIQTSKINLVSLQCKQLTILQKRKRSQRMKILKSKLQTFVKTLLQLTREKTRKMWNCQKCLKTIKLAIIIKIKVSFFLKCLETIQNISSVLYPTWYVLCYLVLISILVQGISVYSMYWIGSQQLPWNISYYLQLGIFFAFTVLQGILSSIINILVPKISSNVSNYLVQKVTKAIAYMQYKRALKQAYLVPTLILNKSNDSYHELNVSIQFIVRGYVAFISSIILVGLTSPVFYAIGAVVAIIYLINQYFFLRVERQIHYFEYLEFAITQIYQQTITGAQTYRTFQKMDQHIQNSKQIIYNQSVYRANHRFVFHGISIICKFLGLCLLTGAVLFAISAKGRLSHNSVGLLGASISFILNLSQMLSDIITETVDLSNILFTTIHEDLDIISQPLDEAFFKPNKPQKWPQNSSIEIENVNIINSMFDEAVIKNLSMRIQSGQQITIFGSDDNGKMGIIYSLLRYFHNQNPSGFIKIADVSVQNIGRKYLMQQIRLLTSDPFSFKGTLRDNIDPFQQFSDKQIVDALIKTKVWNKLKVKKQQIDDTPFNRLNQQFFDRSRYDIIQRVNVARVLLNNPKILIMLSITDCLNRKSASFLENLIIQQFSNSTKIFITQNKDTIIKSDKVAYIQKCKLKDYGPPIEILNKQYKLTTNKEQQIKIQRQMQNQLVIKQIKQRNHLNQSITFYDL